MLVASDNENATIQNIHSVPSFLRKLGKLSVSVWIPNDHINYNFKIIISTTNASKLRFQSENYIWKCHWFTMFSITQTFSVESVTLMVNAVFTARILAIFSIGLETFWKIIVFGNRSLATSCSWNRISSKIMKYLDKCITCCTIMTPPTSLTGTHTICVPTSFAIWWTGQGTVFTVISQLALLSKDNINNQRVCLKYRLLNFFSFFI